MEYGIICLLPIVVMLVVAITTRKCISSMICGIFVGCIIIGGGGFFTTFVDGLYTTGANSDAFWIMSLMITIGVIVAELALTGGASELTKIVYKKVKSERSLYLWSWLLAIILFIEDMMRSAVIGQLSPLYDKHGVPRASLAYFIDASSTTITSLIPITGWAVFFQSVFADFEELGMYGSGFDIYVKTIPYNFYAWAALIVCFLFTIGVIPKLGGMKKAYQKAAETGELYSEESKKLNPPVEVDEDAPVDKVSLITFLFGIVLVTVVILITMDVLVGFLITAFVMPFVLIISKKANWKQAMEACITGASNNVEMALISFFIYYFKDIVTTLQVPEYVIEVMGGIISANMFPVLTFIACCVLTFCSGSTWGVTVVYATIAVPMAVSIGADPILVLAAILSGEAFGAHICFYCDYTVYASACAKINNMEHAFTQIPYGLIGGAIAGIGFFVMGIV